MLYVIYLLLHCEFTVKPRGWEPFIPFIRCNYHLIVVSFSTASYFWLPLPGKSMFFPQTKTIYAVNTLIFGEDYSAHMTSFPHVFRVLYFYSTAGNFVKACIFTSCDFVCVCVCFMNYEKIPLQRGDCNRLNWLNLTWRVVGVMSRRVQLPFFQKTFQ